jgi:hypothetical protein
VFVWSRRDRGRPLQTVELNAPDHQPVREGIACVLVEKGTLGFAVTTERKSQLQPQIDD